MKLNNWLCKHFDIEKKGYVTIWDVAAYVLQILLIGFLGSIIIVAVGLMLSAMQKTGLPENAGLKDSIIIALKGYIIPTIVVVSIHIIYKISQIKIAKCRLKGDDYQTVSGWVSNDDNKQFQK